jgi:hypothetical protein
MCTERLLGSDEGREHLEAGVRELWPYALGVLEPEARPELAARVADRLPWTLSAEIEAVGRGEHLDALREVWEQMTLVRRTAPGAAW